MGDVVLGTGTWTVTWWGVAKRCVYMAPGVSWGRLAVSGSERGTGGEQGASMGVDGVVSDTAWAQDMGVGKTAPFQGIRGKLSGWGRSWGCSRGFRCMLRHFPTAARGPEWARAGDMAVVDDMAGLVGSRWITGASRGEQGAVGGGFGRHCRCWGWLEVVWVIIVDVGAGWGAPSSIRRVLARMGR